MPGNNKKTGLAVYISGRMMIRKHMSPENSDREG